MNADDRPSVTFDASLITITRGRGVERIPWTDLFGVESVDVPSGIDLIHRSPCHIEYLPTETAGLRALLRELKRRGLSTRPNETWARLDDYLREQNRDRLARDFGDRSDDAVEAMSSYAPAPRIEAALLTLAKGDLTKLRQLVELAQVDARDVLAAWERETERG